jgi:phosphonate transport system permease protein
MNKPPPPPPHPPAPALPSAARVAANVPYRLPRQLFNARCTECWFTAVVLVLVVASFWSLDLQWSAFASREAAASMARFLGEFFPPDVSAAFLRKVWWATLETLAMSALGTLLAVVAGLLLAIPASRLDDGASGSQRKGLLAAVGWRQPIRWLFNFFRSIPELVWASMLLIAAGLGPMAGTIALALHTTGVLGRLFAEALENAPPEPAFALRAQGVGEARVFLYARLPQVVPQLFSYTLYRWENNIRAAAVLGVVGAGGLGQLLSFHMGLFHMGKTATILIAMLALVALVDALSFGVRRWLTR